MTRPRRRATGTTCRSIALAYLGPFILGDNALDLGEQAQLGIVVDGGRVVEEHPHAELCELVEDEDLIDVGTGQAIGGQAPGGFERAGFGLIAQRVEPGAVKARP
jgi:hypothetical protein